MDNAEVSAAHVAQGLEYIGKGLNIFDEAYLKTPSGARVIDVSEGNVTITPVRQTTASEVFGSNFAAFTQNFSVQAGLDGSYRGFTASVETKFTRSARESIETKFAQLSRISSGSKLSLSGDPVVLKRYLNADFKAALANANPKDLFEQYGTHVAIEVAIGGMISYYSYSKTTEHLSDSQFEIAAKARYKGFGAEVGANTELTQKEKEEAKTVDGSTNLFVNGGTDGAREAVQDREKGSYVKWANTLADNPGFLGFQPKGLFPIWKLTDDAARAAAIELAFNQEAARQFQILLFMDTGKVAAHPTARVSIPKEYKLLAGGARDNFTGAGNLLTASFPDGSSTWVARGKDHIHHDQASVSVFAIGIYDNRNLWEVAHADATSGNASSPSAQVALPADFVAKGGVLVGGGAQVVNGPDADKLLTSSYPKDTTTWAANATDPENSNPAAIKVFVKGLRCKVEGVKIEVKTHQMTSQRQAHPSERCSPDSGFTLVGGGAFVDYGTGAGNLLISSYPENGHTWAASSKDHIKHSHATITAYAIGLKVS